MPRVSLHEPDAGDDSRNRHVIHVDVRPFRHRYRRSTTPTPGGSEYSPTISSAYFALIGLRLSFIVGVSSSPPGSHGSATIVNRFHLLDARQLRIACNDRGLHLRDHLRVGGNGGQVSRIQAVLVGLHRGHVGIEDHQRRHVGLTVAEGDDLADQR